MSSIIWNARASAAAAGDAAEGGGGAAKTGLAMTASKDTDFGEWYTDLITKSELIAYYEVSGCYILLPGSYNIWERIQAFFDTEIKKLGVVNVYFPLFVSQRALEAEKDHVEGFAPEVRVCFSACPRFAGRRLLMSRCWPCIAGRAPRHSCLAPPRSYPHVPNCFVQHEHCCDVIFFASPVRPNERAGGVGHPVGPDGAGAAHRDPPHVGDHHLPLLRQEDSVAPRPAHQVQPVD